MNAAEKSCPVCGGWLAEEASAGSAVCPACALKGLVDEEPAQERIGAYRLIEELGRGGMGVVWLAEQESPIQREVALKVIKAGMDTREVIARFEAERQALALMDHPGIARVLDAGVTEQGRPFFVMELVEGLPVTEFCDQERLPVRERLRLMLMVCKAVQHAHQKGIIHRDLKPSNVLVARGANGEPVAKVIDFGIAKAVGPQAIAQTLVTQPGQVIGTPQYMSPEQAGAEAMDADTRADVYALGVMLYELLTGGTPLRPEQVRGAALAEVQRLVREAETERPSMRLKTDGRKAKLENQKSESETGKPKSEARNQETGIRQESGNEASSWGTAGTFVAAGKEGCCKPPLLACGDVAARRGTTLGRLMAEVRGDLDWIALKALEKERDRRYGSVAALAEDLQRHLDHEPVLARPPSALYRLRKTARRHRTAFAAGLAVAAALVVATVVSVNAALRARAAEQLAKERLAGAEAVPEFLIHALRSPDPSRNGREVKVVEVLEQAVAEARSRFAAQPLVRARLLEALGQTYHGLGLYAEAAALLGDTASSYVEPGEEGRSSEVKNLIARAIAERFQGRYETALALNEEAWEKATASLGENHSDTLHARYECALNLAFTGRLDEAALIQEEIGCGQAGTAAQRQHMVEDLEVLFMEARGELEPLVAMHTRRSQRPLYLGKRTHNELAASQMEHLGRVLEKLGRVEESLLVREELLLHTWENLGPGHNYTGTAMSILAKAMFEAGRGLEATAVTRLLLADSEREHHVSEVVAGLRRHVEDWSDGFEGSDRRRLEAWVAGLSEGDAATPALLWSARSLLVDEREEKRAHLQRALAARELEVSGASHLLGPRLRQARAWIESGELDAAESILKEMLADEQAARHVLAPLLLHALHDLAKGRGGMEGLHLRERALEFALKGGWLEAAHVRELYQDLQAAGEAAGQPRFAQGKLKQVATALAAGIDPEAIDQMQTALGMAAALAGQGESAAAAECLRLLCGKLAGSSQEASPRRAGMEIEALRLWAELETDRDSEPRVRMAARLHEVCKQATAALEQKRVREALVHYHILIANAPLAGELVAAKERSGAQPDLLSMMTKAGVALYHHHSIHRPMAKALFERLLPQMEARTGHASTRDIRHFLAAIYHAEKRYDLALEQREALIVHLTGLRGESHPDTLTSLSSAGDCLLHLGRKDEAVRVAERCLALEEKARGKDHRDAFRHRETLIGRLANANRKEEALVLIQEQKQLAQAAPQTYPGAYSSALVKEGNILRDLGQWSRAEELFREAMKETPLTAPNAGERNRLQNIIENAVKGLGSVAKQRGIAFEPPAEKPEVKVGA